MRKMYLYLCSILTIGIALSSCQKEESDNIDNNSTYYIKCKIDGTDRQFTANAMAHIMNFGAGMGGSFNVAGNVSSTGLESINLAINFSSSAPAASTYSEDDANSTYTVGGAYNPGSTTIVYGAGMTNQTALPLSITITQIDSKVVSGTFKGAFYKTNVSTGNVSSTEHVTLTEGEFRLPITQ